MGGMGARAEFEALISQWDAERARLQSIIEDPATSPEERVRCIVLLAKLTTKIQALVNELKDSDTIH